jgi:enoyl-CoA hydratase/carnithine racemase
MRDKVVIDDGLDLSFEEHMALSDKHRFKLNDTKDFAEALAAFEEKREPKFIGE